MEELETVVIKEMFMSIEVVLMLHMRITIN